MAREQQRAEHRQVAAGQRRRDGEHARVLGDDVPRAADVAHLLGRGVAQRRRGRATAATASHSARRDAYAEPTSVRGTPQCTTSTAIAGGIATGVTDGVAAVDQQRVAGLAEQRGELVHQPARHAGRRRSRPRTPARAASSPVEPASPARSARARVSATASAELDDSPEPTGTVELDRQVGGGHRARPGRSAPVRRRRRSGPTSARRSRGSSPPSTATSTAPGSVVRDGGHPATATRRTAVTRARAVDRQGRTKPVVVVGVVAHEVHATGSDVAGHLGERTRRGRPRLTTPGPSRDRYWRPMSRFQTSWEIAKRSWAVLKSDKTLAWFPVLSALGSLLVVAVIGGLIAGRRHRQLVDRRLAPADRLGPDRRRLPGAGDRADLLPRRAGGRRRPAPAGQRLDRAHRARHRQLAAAPAPAVGRRHRHRHDDPAGDRGAVRASSARSSPGWSAWRGTS